MKLTLLALAATAFAFAQTPAPAPAPAGGDLMFRMQAIATGLGVTCNHCHSAARGSGDPEPKKEIAKAMIAMTNEINAKIREATGKGPREVTQVHCSTCHRGVPIPGQLSDIITKTYTTQGVDAAVQQYRDLRKQFYGRQAYDFGEETLLGIGTKLTASKIDDAVTFLKLSIELNPQPSRSYAALAYAYTRKFDDPSAITALEKAVEIDPNNNVARGQLEQLKQYKKRTN